MKKGKLFSKTSDLTIFGAFKQLHLKDCTKWFGKCYVRLYCTTIGQFFAQMFLSLCQGKYISLDLQMQVLLTKASINDSPEWLLEGTFFLPTIVLHYKRLGTYLKLLGPSRLTCGQKISYSKRHKIL